MVMERLVQRGHMRHEPGEQERNAQQPRQQPLGCSRFGGEVLGVAHHW
jgi:hypothetical protein